MGAWGYGILQNDTAQDGICEAARRIEGDIADMAANPGEETVARLSAATALLLQFSSYSFNPENDFCGILVAALTANRAYFSQLPGNCEEILNAIIAGCGSELAARDGEVDSEIDRALHSDENDGFIMQKAFSVVETDLLRHPVSAAYLQSIIDAAVEEIDEGFADEEAVSDLSREAYFMGPFGLLLVLPKGHVNPEKFHQWKKRFNDVWKGLDPIEDEDEKKFEAKYNGHLELAFKCGAERFSFR